MSNHRSTPSRSSLFLMLSFLFLFALPQISISQTPSPEVKEAQEALKQYKNGEIEVNDLLKKVQQSNNTQFMDPWGMNSRMEAQKKKNRTINILGVFGMIFMFILFIFIGKKNTQDSSLESNPTTLSAKEKQVAEILEKKNLEKIVEDGLATTIIKVRCRSCNELNEEGNTYCGQCGEKV